MTLLDRYVLREWLQIFALVLAAATGVLILQQVYAELRDLLELGASAGQVLTYFAVALPGFLPLVVPIALLLSLLYVLGTLHRNHEFTAMRVAGLSVWRITRSLWASAALLSAGLLWLNSETIPWSVEQTRSLRDGLGFAAEAREKAAAEVGLVFNLGFDNQRDRRVWMFNRFSEFTLRGYGVTVSELDSARRETRRVMAREAFFDAEKRSWIFVAGRELRFDPVLGEVTGTVPFARQVFGTYREDPRLMLVVGKRPKDLSLLELARLRHTFTEEENPRVVAYHVRYHAILAGTMGCLVVMALAVPFAVTGVRVNPAVGVSKSIGLFFVYYLINTLSLLAGERGQLDPVVAAWTPNGAMLLLALWFFARLR